MMISCLVRTVFVASIFFALNTTLMAADSSDAQFVSIQMPSKMLIGQTYSVKVMVKNTGNNTWSSGSGISLRLLSDNELAWENFQIRVSDNEKIPPGATHAFEGKLRAPQSAGLYQLRWQMTQRGSSFGEKSEIQDIVVEASSSRAKFVSQLVPQIMSANQEYPLVIQFKNQSGGTWRSEDGIELALVSTNATFWNTQRIRLEPREIINNGDIATFSFTIRAPEKPGTYAMQWRLNRDGSGSFGEASPLLNISVGDGAPDVGAEFVFQNIPGLKKWIEFYSIFEQGKVYSVTLTFKNIGRKSWSASEIRLVSREPGADLTWSIDQVELKPNEVIKPNEIKSFNFKVIAPLTPGIYPFQWQLQRAKGEWIGEPSEKVVVTVQ